MKKIDQNNQVQIESLLNECKGNLFEFLVAQVLSRHFKNEDSFLIKCPREFRGRLQFYEETIRNFDPELLKNLPLMAKTAAEKILNHGIFFSKKNISFTVIGKMVATNDNETWNETDIVAHEVLPEGDGKKVYISLKLTKDHSFTNTKSAGIKSFLEKYFASVGPLSFELQKELNALVDESFSMMGHKLYSMLDLEFKGSFDSRWSDQFSELPGELDTAMKDVVHANYFRVAKKIHESLQVLYRNHPEQFYESLHALCGFGNDDIIQVQCFHKNTELKDVIIMTKNDLFSGKFNEIEVMELGDQMASFDINFNKFVLQIRVKPMNKFTTAAYKVNCSIKRKEKSDD